MPGFDSLLIALSFLQEIDHPGGLVVLQEEGFLIPSHEGISLAGFRQREQVDVLKVRRDHATAHGLAKQIEVPNA